MLAQQPTLAENEAHVWTVPLAENSAQFERSWALLDSEERTRADRYRFEPPRRRFVIARGALRTLLGAYLDMPPGDVGFSSHMIGKPCLASDMAANGLQFNVSHSGDYALIALTRGAEVGVDIEELRAVSHLEQIAERYFHPQETAQVVATEVSERGEMFFRCWTAKEAVLKTVGTGLSGALDSFQVPLAAMCADWIDLSAMPNREQVSHCWLERFVPGAGYMAAVSFLNERRKVRRFEFEMGAKGVGRDAPAR